jgi:hypothetical protein
VLYRLSHQESYIENFDVVQHCTGIFAYSDNGNNEPKGYLFSIYSDYTTSYTYSTPLCRTHARTHTRTHARAPPPPPTITPLPSPQLAFATHWHPAVMPAAPTHPLPHSPCRRTLPHRSHLHPTRLHSYAAHAPSQATRGPNVRQAETGTSSGKQGHRMVEIG